MEYPAENIDYEPRDKDDDGDDDDTRSRLPVGLDVYGTQHDEYLSDIMPPKHALGQYAAVLTFLSDCEDHKCIRYNFTPPKATWIVVNAKKYRNMLNEHDYEEDSFRNRQEKE